MKITLTALFDNDKDKKTGQPYMGRNGKPYTRRAIKCKEYGDTYLSGFANMSNKDWKIGDVVDVEIEKVFKDGKEYLNFKSLSRLDLMEKRILALEIDNARKGGGQQPKVDAIEYPDEDINPDDIPF